MTRVLISVMAMLGMCSMPAQAVLARARAVTPRAQSQAQAADQAPQNDESQRALTEARVDLRNHRYDDAIKEFKKAAELKKGQCVECYTYIAQTYFQMGKFKDAVATQKQAITLKPENE